MNTADDHHRKYYCGSKLEYDSFAARQPSFLQRNLRKVLDHHEHSLNILKNRSTNATSVSAATDMLSNNEHPRSLPSMDVLWAATKPTLRTLKVHPIHIIKKRWNPDGGRVQLPKLVAKPKPSGNPTWLPAPNLVQIRCNVHCRIYVHDAENDRLGDLLHTETHLADLIGVEDDKGDMDFSIDVKPFSITEDQMVTTQLANHNTNGGRRWKNKCQPQLVLSLAIDCFNSEDASQLLSVIDPDTSSDTILSPAQAQLRAHWKRLSAYPISTMSALRHYHHDPHGLSTCLNTKEVGYLLRADISWSPVTKSSGTPLAMCNRAMRVADPKKRIQPPTITHRSQICQITYIFDGGPLGSRSIIQTNFSCVFCLDRLPHPTFDRLHFHYLSFHDHFAFKVHKLTATQPNSLSRTVLIELAKPFYERASDNVCDEREIAWIKPETPFNLQKYLSESGSNTWASGKQLPLKTFPKTVKPSCMSNGATRLRTSFANAQSAPTPADRPPNVGPPEEVKEVPPRKRKRHTVPVIPNVTIFRAESKREVKPGEGLSESDAEPDDTWLRTKHGVEDFPQLTGAAREFAGLFDGYLLQDEPRNLANVHVCEAVVRFVRRFAVQLRQPHLLHELRRKLDELMDMGLISDEYAVYCLALIDGKIHERTNSGPAVKEEPSSGTSHIPPSTALPGHNKLDVIMIDDSDTEPGAEVSPAIFSQTNGHATDMQDTVYHAPHACVCGTVALGSHKVITCRNVVSSSHVDQEVDCSLTTGIALPTHRVPYGLCWSSKATT
jgi:hypothetical protein